MRRQPREQLLQLLWPAHLGTNTDVYAVLDGARDSRIAARVEDYRDKKASLFAGPLTRELANAAPQLVRMFRDDGFCKRLLDDGWGASWGIFVHAELSLPSLRRHLRRLLIVQGPNRERLIFRWYDPRVLRRYLPTCNAEELREIFGPIDTLFVEGKDFGTVHRYTFDGRVLSDQLVRFDETA